LSVTKTLKLSHLHHAFSEYWQITQADAENS
jgi:hypothetical protein